MSDRETDWTILITVEQVASQDAVSPAQQEAILGALGRDDAWIQYPPASGRGHGFETRWWQRGADAGTVAASAIERHRAAVARVGLEVHIVLVHVATPDDRLNETVIGLERRRDDPDDPDEAGTWNVMIRAIAGPGSEGASSRRLLERLLAILGADSSGWSRERLLEVRFWIEGDDAVDATDRGAAAFTAALNELGLTSWQIVRAHTTSLAEARRTAYLGVERRMRERDRDSLTVVLHP